MVATRALAALAAVVLALGTTPAAAESLTATYAVTWRGLEVGTFDAEVAADDDGYRAAWQGRTTGLAGTLFPFATAGASEGARGRGGAFLPREHTGRSRWRDGNRAWRVVFGGDGRAAKVEVPADELAEREPVPAALRVGPDPAALALTAIAAAEPGARMVASSFDGKRAVRFALTCGDAASDQGGVGPAEIACAVESQLLAGASRRWRERSPGAREAEPVRIWLRQGVSGQGYWPVRVQAASRFGMVEARLVRLEHHPAAG
jgi:Protein of unknown function (DUF3108)